MKSLSSYREKNFANEYESEFDFSQYLINKKNDKNFNNNSISINDIPNLNKSCKIIIYLTLS